MQQRPDFKDKEYNMQLTVISIIHKLPSWVNSACNEYIKRINTGRYSCKLIDIKAEAHYSTPENNMHKESKKILSHIPDGSLIIALDERGKTFTSTAFADKLDKLTLTHSHICFIIGGADGLHSSIKESAHMLLQLSSFTLPHAIARVMLCEQIYRAISILNNHPYHRE